MTDDAPANGTPEHPADGPPPAPPAAPGSAPGTAPGTAMTPPPGAIVTDPDPATDDRGAGDAPPPPTGTGHPDPSGPDFPTRVTRAGTAGGVVALGTGLLGAAVVIAAVRARGDGELDWSTYGVGLGATAVLFVIAVLGALADRRAGGRARQEVVTWPGVVGIGATALMIGVGINRDDDWVAYLIGGTMAVLGAIGYLAARRAAFVVVAIAGLALVYGVAFDGVVSDSVGDGHPQVTAAVLVAVFVVVVTLLGWALPSRAVSGVAVGAFGLVGFLGILASFAVMRFFAGVLGGMSTMLDREGGGVTTVLGAGGGFPESDVWWVVVLGGVLAVLWALAAAVSDHSGFSLLAIAMLALGAPLASVALAAEHPTWWAAIAAAAGGILLLGSVALARLRGRRTAGLQG
ncbi:hypothetical protein [Nocardioides sp. BYT-33-1]|uniref:hypothetical protein n=1 Tax=Nocardioides sp. BYT-33-1 TaxID=3416952 RepID=UPI003F537E4E